MNTLSNSYGSKNVYLGKLLIGNRVKEPNTKVLIDTKT